MSAKSPPRRRRDASAEARARLATYLVDAGRKHSRARDAVVDAFLDTPGHPSAEELTAIVHRRAPGVGHTTVYRTLKLLAASGLAVAREFGDGQARYERAVERAHHDHLVCTGCGAILEFEDDDIEELQDAVARRHGFEIATHRLEIYGRCSACVARGRPEPR